MDRIIWYENEQKEFDFYYLSKLTSEGFVKTIKEAIKLISGQLIADVEDKFILDICEDKYFIDVFLRTRVQCKLFKYDRTCNTFEVQSLGIVDVKHFIELGQKTGHWVE